MENSRWFSPRISIQVFSGNTRAAAARCGASCSAAEANNHSKEFIMKNFLRSFKTSLVGAIFGGGMLTDAVYTGLQTGHFDTKTLFGGFAILALGILAKDAGVAGTVEQPVAPVAQ
jgi:hypothetical protein